MPPWAWEAWGSGRSLRSFCGCRSRAGWGAGGAQGQRGDGSVPAALSRWSFGPAGCRSPSEEPLPTPWLSVCHDGKVGSGTHCPGPRPESPPRPRASLLCQWTCTGDTVGFLAGTAVAWPPCAVTAADSRLPEPRGSCPAARRPWSPRGRGTLSPRRWAAWAIPKARRGRQGGLGRGACGAGAARGNVGRQGAAGRSQAAGQLSGHFRGMGMVGSSGLHGL